MSQKLKTFDDEIAAYIRSNEQNGELRQAPSWGKPLANDDGFDATPEDLRMGYKMLKSAGYVPPEVEMMNRLSAMRVQLSILNPCCSEAEELRQEIRDLQLKVTLQMESLRA